MKQKFVAVLLGTDANSYGMARSFYEEYNIKSIVLGKARLYATKYSDIVQVKTFDNFDKQEVFIEKIMEIAKENSQKYEKMILISCGDGYTELIVNNKNKLEEYFVVPYVDKDLKEKLENKENFYLMCEKYGLEYPKTYICTYKNKNKINIPFGYPVAVKPSNSISYLDCSFVGKKKSFKANNEKELKEIVKRIYGSKYRDNVIIQDFIPGDDSSMYVLNCYSNKKGEVKGMCLGHVLLEEYSPGNIGNYTAIISTGESEIYKQTKEFLERIKFVGFSNFDIKYDERDKKYKFFEINIRQGRSSYYVTGCGMNMAKFLVDEYIYKTNNKIVYNENEWLWLGVSKGVVLKYANESQKQKIKEMIKNRKYGHTLIYKKDINIRRMILISKLYGVYKNNYKLYYNKRGIFE